MIIVTQWSTSAMSRKTTEVRRQEIVQSALQLMLEEGVKGITTKNLACRNNITEGAIYRHFKDKRSIILGMIETMESTLAEVIDKQAGLYENPLDQLREIMREHIVFTEHQKGILFALTAESIHFNDNVLRRKIWDVMQTYTGKIQNILRSAYAQGMTKRDLDVETSGFVFFGLIETAVIQYSMSNYRELPVTKFNALWDMFLHGIQPPQ